MRQYKYLKYEEYQNKTKCRAKGIIIGSCECLKCYNHEGITHTHVKCSNGIKEEEAMVVKEEWQEVVCKQINDKVLLNGKYKIKTQRGGHCEIQLQDGRIVSGMSRWFKKIDPQISQTIPKASVEGPWFEAICMNNKGSSTLVLGKTYRAKQHKRMPLIYKIQGIGNCSKKRFKTIVQAGVYTVRLECVSKKLESNALTIGKTYSGVSLSGNVYRVEANDEGIPWVYHACCFKELPSGIKTTENYTLEKPQVQKIEKTIPDMRETTKIQPIKTSKIFKNGQTRIYVSVKHGDNLYNIKPYKGEEFKFEGGSTSLQRWEEVLLLQLEAVRYLKELK